MTRRRKGSSSNSLTVKLVYLLDLQVSTKTMPTYFGKREKELIHPCKLDLTKRVNHAFIHLHRKMENATFVEKNILTVTL
jgi:hypothetical protein